MQSHKVISRPIRLHWAGWETTSLQLQHHGWELSAEEDYHQMGLRIAFRHKDFKVYGVTQVSRMDYYRYWDSHTAIGDDAMPILQVRWLTTDLIVNIQDNLTNFKPFDAVPQFESREMKSIEDFGIFATPMVRTEEIIVDPHDVAAMLTRIKELQSPKQKEIREKMRKEHYRGMEVDAIPRQQFHAQILSVV